MKPFLRALGAKTDKEMSLAYPYSMWITILGPLLYTPNGGFLPLFRCENRATTAMIV